MAQIRYEDVAEHLQITQREFELLSQAEIKELLGIYDDGLKSIMLDFRYYLQDETFYTNKKQRALMIKVNASLGRFEERFTERLSSSINSATSLANESARDDITRSGLPIKHDEEFHKKLRARLVQNATEDAYDYIAGQTKRMSMQMKQHLRATSAEVFRRAAAGGLTQREAAREIQSQIKRDDPQFKFVDRAGRRWDSEKYFHMLAFTVIQNARREAYVETCVQEGHDLVMISAHQAIDRCRPWENRILSLTGKTKGYPTYAQSKASGDIWHPRCRHFLIAVNP